MDAVKREKQIPDRFGRINSALDELGKTCEVLGQTIEPVLQPIPPQNVGTDSLKPKESMAPLANWLTDIEGRIRDATRRLQDYNARTEV